MKPYDAVKLIRRMGIEPDPWQRDVLENRYDRLLLNCCRQAGKSTVVAALALAEAIFIPGTQVLLISRSFQQASELFRKIKDFHFHIGEFLKLRRNAHELALKGNSRIICLPCKKETIRGYSGIDLLLLDEAAQVPDDIYRTVRPMLAVSGGRMICLSTPYGKRGFFWDAWTNGGDDWARIQIAAAQLPRIKPEFLDAERRGLGSSWYRQEYCCSFEALEGLVFPKFERCLTPSPFPAGKPVGGIDFGYRNPFAAVWGVLDQNRVLWIRGEHYSREQSLSFHAKHLPREVTWYCDPSGATERAELRQAGFTIREGKNALRPGIAAVNARIESGRLFVRDCPNLVAEAGLYRYSDDPAERRAEIPIDEHNHALAALRYLVAAIDDGRQIERPKKPAVDESQLPPLTGWGPVTGYKDRGLLYNEAVWTRIS
jgi:hypothetical protein